jgi:hypothetical protein
VKLAFFHGLGPSGQPWPFRSRGFLPPEASYALFQYCQYWIRLTRLILIILPMMFGVARAAESLTTSCVVPIDVNAQLVESLAPHQLAVYDMFGQWPLLRVGGALFRARSQSGVWQLTRIDTEFGDVLYSQVFNKMGLLIQTEKGWRFVRSGPVPANRSSPYFERVDAVDVFNVYGAHEVTENTMLIHAKSGLYEARLSLKGDMSIQPLVNAAPGSTLRIHQLPGFGLFLHSDLGLFVVRDLEGKLKPSQINSAELGRIFRTANLPKQGAMIFAEKGLFFVKTAEGKLTIEGVPGFGPGIVEKGVEIASGVLAHTTKGLFLFRAKDGKLSKEAIGNLVDTNGSVVDPRIAAEKGFQAAMRRSTDFAGIVSHVPDIRDIKDVPEVGVFIRGGGLSWPDGLFLAHLVNEKLIIVKLKNGNLVEALFPTQTFSDVRNDAATWPMLRLPGYGVMFMSEGSEQALEAGNARRTLSLGGRFLSLKTTDVELSQQVVDAGRVGRVLGANEIPGIGGLVRANNGLFIARPVNGVVQFERAGNVDTGKVFNTVRLSGADTLIWAEKGLFLASNVAADTAQIAIKDKYVLDGSAPDKSFDRNVIVTVRHACAPLLDVVYGRLKVSPPGREPMMLAPTRVNIKGDSAELFVPTRIDTEGDWKFEVALLSENGARRFGQPEMLRIKRPATWREILQEWGWWLGLGLTLMLASLNATLFISARYSPVALRAATGDALSTWVLRGATQLLSFWPYAQLWILDAFFQRRRQETGTPQPFLPLPLRGPHGATLLSSVAVAPPWTRKRLWIQGKSGMGKTALFKEVTASHFRESETSFDAYAKWQCIVVALSARDFATGQADASEPTWVLTSVRATLSKAGFTFDDDKLFVRIMRSGIIAVAIDGLHEAGQSNAVDAFARAFSFTPMLVTSQEQGSDLFEVWKLPDDMQGFTKELLTLHVGEGAAQIIEARLRSTGLGSAIRSGYDVRLVGDIARASPENAPLPSNRLALYELVLKVGWPDAHADLLREQMDRTSAAAWRLVSERKPHEDKRRMRPDVDLPSDLLNALADAPERDRKPVRLVRRVGGAFEFVHDQMHAYLAARWFALSGFTTGELIQMVKTSTIWMHSKTERQMLWSFVAPLLADEPLVELWSLVDEQDEWDTLRRELKAEAGRRRLQFPTPS